MLSLWQHLFYSIIKDKCKDFIIEQIFKMTRYHHKAD
nr:MAG TPA: hypothetical protein [Caudoviricetes sp.]